MNVNINIPGLDSQSPIGLRVGYLNNLIFQWRNIGFNDSHNYNNTVNSCLSQMAAYLLNDGVNSQNAKDYYDLHIDDIETKKQNSFEQWETSLRDIYINPGKFNII